MDQLSPTKPASPAAADHPSPTSAGRADRWGWTAIGVITAVMAASWAPQLALPLGNNHVGRVFGRHALHLRNLQEKGLVDSAFSADWSPYVSRPYAHHPPLLNMFDVLFGLLPGSGPYEILIGPFLLALLVVPAAAALLRGFGISWPSTLLAVGLMAVTGFFWLYSPLMFDMGLILGLAASIRYLRTHAQPPRRQVVLACLLALITTLASWPGIALAAVFGLWLLAARRLDRVTIAVGVSMVVGVAVSLLFIVGVSGMENLVGQTEYRTAEGGFTVREFLRRQYDYARALLPIWYIILLPIAGIAGLAARRTRFLMLVLTAFAAGWVILLNNGSYIHDYWAYPVLLPGVLGMGVLVDWIISKVPAKPFALAATVVGLGLAVAFGSMVFGRVASEKVYRPADAGRLVAQHPPAPGQTIAWAGPGISAPRWLSYYWDLPPRGLTQNILTDPAANPDDLVLIKVNRLPAWIPESVVGTAVARDGQYALIRVANIRAASQG